MIPKIIHYCWLSDDPVPNDFQRYMASWKEKMPDYEYVKWDFNRLPKEHSIWVKEAFENRKYAFAADYIRIYALYTMGGIYLDMDVEVLKPFDNFLNQKCMICWQNGYDGLEVAAFGYEKGAAWMKKYLDFYKDRHFVLSDGTFEMKPLPYVVEDFLKKNGCNLVSVEGLSSVMNVKENEIHIFPPDFFSPKSYKNGRLNITGNTICIHHFAGSWISFPKKILYSIKAILGISDTGLVVKLKKMIKW